ncbi:MAG: hypothetical protein LBK61_02040 [Spirochaetaceae bacterium]|nr:hypothetical protein [Spirochaetaceae bacterium]
MEAVPGIGAALGVRWLSPVQGSPSAAEVVPYEGPPSARRLSPYEGLPSARRLSRMRGCPRRDVVYIF